MSETIAKGYVAVNGQPVRSVPRRVLGVKLSIAESAEPSLSSSDGVSIIAGTLSEAVYDQIRGEISENGKMTDSFMVKRAVQITFDRLMQESGDK